MSSSYTNKAVPLLRDWELNETSTRYEHNLAAPSDGHLEGFWWAWGGVALLAGLFTLTVFLGIVLSKQARRQSFNLYLVYLMIPDIAFSLLCGTSCLLNAVKGQYWSHWMCNFQQFYCVFGIGANCWLNAVIARELHKLLRYSHQRRRYVHPTRQTVTRQALAVYLYCAFLGTWGLIDRANFPYHAVQIRGLACIPVEVDPSSSLFFWLAFLPLFAGIPMVYVMYVGFTVWKRQLLPPSGKRRLLVVYFGRIVVVFFAMWGPYFLLNYIFAAWLPTWVIFAGGFFSHFQGPASAGLSLLKPDIGQAYKRLFRCKCGLEDGQHPTVECGHEATEATLERSPSTQGLLLGLSSAFSRSLRRLTVPSLDAPAELPEAAIATTLTTSRISSSSSSIIWPNQDGNYSRDEDDDNNEKEEVEDEDFSTNEEAVDPC